MKPLTINGVRLLKHGLRCHGQYCPVRYSRGRLVDGREAITLYALSVLNNIPAALGTVENNTEIQADYFETDRVRFYAGTPEFAAIVAAGLTGEGR